MPPFERNHCSHFWSLFFFRIRISRVTRMSDCNASPVHKSSLQYRPFFLNMVLIAHVHALPRGLINAIKRPRRPRTKTETTVSPSMIPTTRFTWPRSRFVFCCGESSFFESFLSCDSLGSNRHRPSEHNGFCRPSPRHASVRHSLSYHAFGMLTE